MITGKVIFAPPHITSYNLVDARWLEVFPQSMRDLRDMAEIPLENRTYCETPDDGHGGQSPRLVLLSEARRRGWC